MIVLSLQVDNTVKPLIKDTPNGASIILTT